MHVIQPRWNPPRLAISVFNAEEVRAALAGGADIVDCEDPRSALGMFEPRIITDIAYAVHQTSGSAVVPTSANIGIPQVVKGTASNQAALRSGLEIRAKAAQEALGLAAAMDVGDGRSNIIKFEVDGLKAPAVSPFVSAVKGAVRQSRQFQNHRVIASILEINRAEWARRRSDSVVIQELLRLGEFFFDRGGDINLSDHFRPAQVARMMDEGGSDQPRVRLIEPSDPVRLGLKPDLDERLAFFVETLAKAGADGVMIDTPIQAKVAGICLVAEGEPTDQQPSRGRPIGTISIDRLKIFSELCAYYSVECWLAGSIQPRQAGLLAILPDLDVVMCRGAASAEVRNPYGKRRGGGRASRRISASRVRALATALKGPDGYEQDA
jgi:uncharacterized protein (UPF0264 family)